MGAQDVFAQYRCIFVMYVAQQIRQEREAYLNNGKNAQIGIARNVIQEQKKPSPVEKMVGSAEEEIIFDR